MDLSEFRTGSATDMGGMFYNCKKLKELDLTSFDTQNVTDMWGMFMDSGVCKLELSSFNTGKVTDTNHMFAYCGGLQELDLTNFDAGNMVNLGMMFGCCSGLKKLDFSNFRTKNAQNTSFMFLQCAGLEELDLSGFETGAVISMWGMFSGCGNLKTLDLSGFDTKNVTDMREMFSGCGVTELDMKNFDTRNVTKMDNMFENCGVAELNLESFDTGNVSSMRYMFSGCANLKKLDLGSFDTQNVTGMEGMFISCSSLTELNVKSFNTEHVDDMTATFYNCNSLKELDLSGFNIENLRYYMSNTFSDELQVLHTPHTVGNVHLSLPGTYYDPDGNQTEELIEEFAGTTLTRQEAEKDLDAFQVVVEETNIFGIGKKASFKVRITNNTEKTLVAEKVYGLYFQDNTEYEPVKENFGTFSEEDGTEIVDALIYAPGESRIFKLSGIIPDTWNENSVLRVNIEGHEEGSFIYLCYGQGDFSKYPIEDSENGDAGDSNTGDVGTGDNNTGNGGSGDSNTGDDGNGGTGDNNTGSGGTGDSNTGDAGNVGTGDNNTGDAGNVGTGDNNTGDDNSGAETVGNGSAGNENAGSDGGENSNIGGSSNNYWGSVILAEDGMYEVSGLNWENVDRGLMEAVQETAADLPGRNVDVVTGGQLEVPAYVLEDLVGRNVTLALHVGSRLALSITGTDLREGNRAFAVRIAPVGVSEEMNRRITENVAEYRAFRLECGEAFPFHVNVHIGFGAENAGRMAVLYRIDRVTGSVAVIGIFQVNEDGQAMFGLAQEGEYTAAVLEGSEGVISYTVMAGDTLRRIASRHGMTIEQMKAVNPEIKNINKIRVGQRLHVYP